MLATMRSCGLACKSAASMRSLPVVKAIAEDRGVKMPSFFGYMLWSGGILVPLFVVMSFIWFK